MTIIIIPRAAIETGRRMKVTIIDICLHAAHSYQRKIIKCEIKKIIFNVNSTLNSFSQYKENDLSLIIIERHHSNPQ